MMDEDENSCSDSDEENQDGIILKTLSCYYSEFVEAKVEPAKSFEFTKNNSCLICLSAIKKAEAVWSCTLCYTIFHLMCIQQWAKDGIVVANTILSQDVFPGIVMKWTCPKCRVEYEKRNIPSVYRCFCGKQIDPPPDPWLLAHSCGSICGRDLKSSCGHKCLSLCHPGPCPPCPKTVFLSCYCGQSLPKAQRCGSTGWSCGKICKHALSCDLHTCELLCHEGPCPQCPEKVMQACVCGKEVREQPCDQPEWSCGQKCGKLLPCLHHHCQRECHSNSCGNCPRTGERACPCGKKKYRMLECTSETPCCGDTCLKALDCERHQCVRMCHLGDCGPCLQSYEKLCRCGQKKKSLLCNQEYLCDSRCQRIRQCGRHQCRKKCCAGNCPPCEQLCGRLLSCKSHKCSSPCHSGQCYPCVLSVSVSCACGKTSISVPCGNQRTTKAPRCSHPCHLPPSCHHSQSSVHRCHFGECPPCKQMCLLPLSCKHLCSALCHSRPVCPPQGKPVAPWKKVEPVPVVMPCPPCVQPVSKACFGGHEVRQFGCSDVSDYSCPRLCGRVLQCGNHSCQRSCHTVINAPDTASAGDDCFTCELPCQKRRHPDCKHTCLLPCHPGTCPPCEATLKLSCHCFNINVYVKCSEWCVADNQSRNIMRTCNSQCPKMLSCGHQCPQSCHPGPCISTDQCRKKITVRCPCRRLKKEWKCNEQEVLECSEECLSIKQKHREAIIIAANEAAALKVKEEEAAVALIERQLRPRKRKKKLAKVEVGVEDSTSYQLKFLALGFVIVGLILLSIIIYFK